MSKPTAISFSGGRTSGYMLHRILKINSGSVPADFHVLFANTGKERPETLDFVNEVQVRWGVRVVWLEYRRANNEHRFEVVNYNTASRKGEPFDQLLGFLATLPNVRGRSCTAELKIRTMKRYLKSLGLTTWFDAIGIRADEIHRVAKVEAICPKYITPLFPLAVAGITEKDVLAFWKTQPFDLNLKTYEGNCDLCFLKSRGKINAIMREHPELAKWWIEKEREFSDRVELGPGFGNVFRADRPNYSQMFSQMNEQGLLVGDEDQIACACTDGGMFLEGEDLI